VRDGGTPAELPRTGAVREGVGFRSTRSRLQYLYGSDHSFRYGFGSDGVFWVAVSIPMRVNA
jgi:hypothetical protein